MKSLCDRVYEKALIRYENINELDNSTLLEYLSVAVEEMLEALKKTSEK